MDLRQDHKIDSKREYLLDYPGFDRAFGTSLDMPGRHNSAWADCSEPDANLDPERAGPELGRRILAGVEELRASANPNVIIVFVPRSWKLWERFETEGERFDLHDFVKAACVQRGIATQFLREETLEKAHQGEILWWLALSCYVKAMRTPWVLDGMDPDLAFLGLGFSLDPTAGRGKRVLMGCSHVYNAEGLGLSYKLGKLESSIMRRGNPFLSKGDARRMAENALQLFFESRGRMPGRIVVHKNSPIAEDERHGLLEGLGDVPSVDMLEITEEPALRYVASQIYKGEFKGDGFPVRRGTAIVLDGRRALAWVHGTVDAVDDRRRYYQGKSRIPAPSCSLATTVPLRSRSSLSSYWGSRRWTGTHWICIARFRPRFAPRTALLGSAACSTGWVPIPTITGYSSECSFRTDMCKSRLDLQRTKACPQRSRRGISLSYPDSGVVCQGGARSSL